jgi:DedD protein
MERSLKERLIGAAVLVVLAVWLIPLVLNGPVPAVEAEPEVLELPVVERSNAVRIQTIRLDENREPPTLASRSETVVALTPNPAPEFSASRIETDLPEPPPQAATANEVRGSSEELHQAPLVSEEPGPSGGEAWVVQIGSFSEEDNAQRLAQRVAGLGFNARVSTFNASAGPMYRVRLGPESSRERAVEIVSSLSTHGFVAQVVGQD